MAERSYGGIEDWLLCLVMVVALETKLPSISKQTREIASSLAFFVRNHLLTVLAIALGTLAMAGLGQNAHQLWLVHVGFGITYLLLLLPIGWGILKLLGILSSAGEERTPVIGVITLCCLFILVLIPFHWDKVSSLKESLNSRNSGPALPEGNLKERALAFADEIVEFYLQNGWKDRDTGPLPHRTPSGNLITGHMPFGDPQGMQDWRRGRSHLFRFKYWTRVHEMRDEFKSVHLQDARLDEIIDINDKDESQTWFDPRDAEAMADSFRKLAGELPK